MKKTYQNPTIEIVKVPSAQLLSGSNPQLGSSFQSGETVLGHDNDDDFDW